MQSDGFLQGDGSNPRELQSCYYDDQGYEYTWDKNGYRIWSCDDLPYNRECFTDGYGNQYYFSKEGYRMYGC